MVRNLDPMKTPLRNMNPKSGRVMSDLYGTEKESDSSSHGSKPQLAPAHEWSDDCVSEKTEQEEL